VVEWLAFLLRIREITGSNFSSESGYFDGGFSCFSQCLQSNAVIYIKLGHDRFLSNPFQFISPHCFIRRYVAYVTERALLNKLQINRLKEKRTVRVGIHVARRNINRLCRLLLQIAYILYRYAV
jgi:hypothetical protein